MSVDILNTLFGRTDRENGTQLDVPIDYSVTELSNTPGIRTFIGGGTILAGKTFTGINAKILVGMADPVEFVSVSLTENGNHMSAQVNIPYVGESDGEYVYSMDGALLFAGGAEVAVGPNASAAVEISTSAYPSQAVLPITFLVDRLELDEGAAPPVGDCFWTGVVGATQDCGGDTPEPPANFIFVEMAGSTDKVCVATASGMSGGVASSVLVKVSSELRLLEFSGATAGNDPLVGSGVFPSLRNCTMSETAVYAQTVDYGTGTGMLLMKAIPYASFKGAFDSYTCDVDVGAAIGFDGSLDSVMGLEWYPQENSVILVVLKGTSRAMEIWAKYDNADLATGWQKQGEIPAPESPGSLSDNKVYFDPQLQAVVLQQNNGRSDADNIWWARTLGRDSGSRPGGYNTLITVTGGALWWNGVFRFWQTDSGTTYLIGDNADGHMVKCDFSGNVSPLFDEFTVAAYAPFGEADGGGELGSRVFIAPATNCSGEDLFGFLWRMDNDRVPTTVNLAYSGCQVYAVATPLKRVFGRLTNQCI